LEKKERKNPIISHPPSLAHQVMKNPPSPPPERTKVPQEPICNFHLGENPPFILNFLVSIALSNA
jgi:hypothetical protein